MKRNSLVIAGFIILCLSCNQKNRNFELPILGRKKIVETIENGIARTDTLDHTIANFVFHNQDSMAVSIDTYSGKIYVADFFFTSCPTICPTMKKQMLRVYEKYLENDTVGILSHTIDPTYDNVEVLKAYANALGVSAPKWNFVTGNQDDIYGIGESSYLVTAGEDDEAPGGYIHSGAFILVDHKQRIRGVYDGTLADQVDILLNDIDLLLREVSNEK
jgi:protein SCO1/2